MKNKANELKFTFKLFALPIVYINIYIFLTEFILNNPIIERLKDFEIFRMIAHIEPFNLIFYTIVSMHFNKIYLTAVNSYPRKVLGTYVGTYISTKLFILILLLLIPAFFLLYLNLANLMLHPGSLWLLPAIKYSGIEYSREYFEPSFCFVSFSAMMGCFMGNLSIIYKKLKKK
ncbi:MAG: hypothetical protein K2X39_06900 [Silvanigrellaceae bacterium]|nr:hypothetical protein [Silvanigrellaceae bacterium]